MKKLMIAAGFIVILIFGGFFMYRHFVTNMIMDGPNMENTYPEESESQKKRELSEMAELVEFSWNQSAMSFSDCFYFWMKITDLDPQVPYLYCDYTDRDTGERITLGDEMFIYRAGRPSKNASESDAERNPSVPLERWRELADFLRTAELEPYSPPSPDLLDATTSKIELTWTDGDQTFTECYDGRSAYDLRELLQDIVREVPKLH